MKPTLFLSLITLFTTLHAEPFQKGQQVVARKDVDIKRGKQVIAAANRGERMTVLSVSGSWVGVALDSPQGTKRGWVKSGYLMAAPASVRTPSTQTSPRTSTSSDTGLGTGDWAAFRGPNFGTSSEKLPTEWSATENVAWKTALPGPGSSSPIVVGDRIYITCYTGYGLTKENPGDLMNLKRHLLCVNRADGKIIWNKAIPTVREGMKYGGFLTRHGYASSTPISDGERIFVYFGNSGAYAFDLNGKQLWRTDCGQKTHGFGSGASPILHGNLVIFNASAESGSLIALEKLTGGEVWRSDGIKDAWNTPIIIEANGHRELIVACRKVMHAINPDDGAKLWRWTGHFADQYVCPSIVFHDGNVLAMNSYAEFVSIRPGGNGDITDTHTNWKERVKLSVSSPVYNDGHIFIASDDRFVACFNIKEGGRPKTARFQPKNKGIYASPIVAGGRLYIVSIWDGAYVFSATPDLKLIAHNKIEGDDTDFNASPVPHKGQLLLRSNKFLYCIGK